jgi:predicted AlkP superfamily phosphohydrolase/phosphomutase
MHKLMMILLDAIEPSLVERWMEDGSLPNLRKLRQSGRFGRLASDLKIAGLPWLPLYTGRRDAAVPPYFLIWNPKSMSLERLPASVLDVPIFWRNLPQNGLRAIVVDMPFVSKPVPFDGIEITAWMTHDTIFESTQTSPEKLGPYLIEKYGRDLRFKETYGTLGPAEFQGVKDRLVDMTRRVTDLALDFLHHEKWDLFVVGYSTLHSAGHKLWDQTNVRGDPDHAQTSRPLQDVYIAADRAVGRLLAALDPQTYVLVLSVHGMRSNSTCNEILPEMLQRALADEMSTPSNSGGWLRKLRQLVPYELRHRIKSRLPLRMQDLLTSYWRSGVGNWQYKKAFTIASDVQGMIRLNLQGREKRGIVPPAEYEAVCRQIINGLKTFIDADTGLPIIREVVHTDAILREHAPADIYPDLLVDWADTPAAAHRAVSSPVFGAIPWPTPGYNPEGRSGNHTMTGMLLAVGPDITAGPIESARVIDIAPTVLDLLGQPVPEEMDGRPIALRD